MLDNIKSLLKIEKEKNLSGLKLRTASPSPVRFHQNSPISNNLDKSESKPRNLTLEIKKNDKNITENTKSSNSGRSQSIKRDEVNF